MDSVKGFETALYLLDQARWVCVWDRGILDQAVAGDVEIRKAGRMVTLLWSLRMACMFGSWTYASLAMRSWMNCSSKAFW
jgi:hypothetical protein